MKHCCIHVNQNPSPTHANTCSGRVSLRPVISRIKRRTYIIKRLVMLSGFVISGYLFYIIPLPNNVADQKILYPRLLSTAGKLPLTVAPYPYMPSSP